MNDRNKARGTQPWKDGMELFPVALIDLLDLAHICKITVIQKVCSLITAVYYDFYLINSVIAVISLSSK